METKRSCWLVFPKAAFISLKIYGSVWKSATSKSTMVILMFVFPVKKDCVQSFNPVERTIYCVYLQWFPLVIWELYGVYLHFQPYSDTKSVIFHARSLKKVEAREMAHMFLARRISMGILRFWDCWSCSKGETIHVFEMVSNKVYVKFSFIVDINCGGLFISIYISID